MSNRRFLIITALVTAVILLSLFGFFTYSNRFNSGGSPSSNVLQDLLPNLFRQQITVTSQIPTVRAKLTDKDLLQSYLENWGFWETESFFYIDQGIPVGTVDHLELELIEGELENTSSMEVVPFIQRIPEENKLRVQIDVPRQVLSSGDEQTLTNQVNMTVLRRLFKVTHNQIDNSVVSAEQQMILGFVSQPNRFIEAQVNNGVSFNFSFVKQAHAQSCDGNVQCGVFRGGTVLCSTTGTNSGPGWSCISEGQSCGSATCTCSGLDSNGNPTSCGIDGETCGQSPYLGVCSCSGLGTCIQDYDCSYDTKDISIGGCYADNESSCNSYGPSACASCYYNSSCSWTDFGGGYCGDGFCDAAAGEGCGSCATDCGDCPYCGDGVCSAEAGEDSDSCEIDCGPPPVVCGDGRCDNTGTDVCDLCEVDCGVCSDPGGWCGDGSCGTGESCSNCASDCGSCPTVCGNNRCESGENCNNCSQDCGSCPVVGCGDGSCTGSEDCNSCSVDCGVCPGSTGLARLMVSGGDVYAGGVSGIAFSSVSDPSCELPACNPFVLTNDQADTEGSAGVIITGGGAVDTGGYTTQGDENIEVIGSAVSRIIENYGHFYRKYSLGFNPVNDFEGTSNDAQKPVSGEEYYFADGNLTIQTPWDVTGGESIVVFVDGNLNLMDPTDAGELIRVDDQSFLAFIVSGDITIADTVGNSDLSSTTGNVEGIYIADGSITTESAGAGSD